MMKVAVSEGHCRSLKCEDRGLQGSSKHSAPGAARAMRWGGGRRREPGGGGGAGRREEPRAPWRGRQRLCKR